MAFSAIPIYWEWAFSAIPIYWDWAFPMNGFWISPNTRDFWLNGLRRKSILKDDPQQKYFPGNWDDLSFRENGYFFGPHGTLFLPFFGPHGARDHMGTNIKKLKRPYSKKWSNGNLR